jgi:hypothetical protein
LPYFRQELLIPQSMGGSYSFFKLLHILRHRHNTDFVFYKAPNAEVQWRYVWRSGWPCNVSTTSNPPLWESFTKKTSDIPVVVGWSSVLLENHIINT